MSTVVATSPVKEIGVYLESEPVMRRLADLLPESITPIEMVRMTMLAVADSPTVQRCAKASIFQSVMKAAEMKLVFTKQLGEAYLVPFFSKKDGAYLCEMVVGYRGLMKLAYQSGAVESIYANLVHESDGFSVEMGTSPGIRHKRFTGGHPGAVVGAYAVCWMKGAARPVFEYMSIDELESVRGRSKAKDGGPWVTDTGEMYRKTVLRRLCKHLPMCTEASKSVAVDADCLADQDQAEAKDVSVEGRMSQLTEQLASGHQNQDGQQSEPSPSDGNPSMLEQVSVVVSDSLGIPYKQAEFGVLRYCEYKGLSASPMSEETAAVIRAALRDGRFDGLKEE